MARRRKGGTRGAPPRSEREPAAPEPDAIAKAVLGDVERRQLERFGGEIDGVHLRKGEGRCREDREAPRTRAEIGHRLDPRGVEKARAVRSERSPG